MEKSKGIKCKLGLHSWVIDSKSGFSMGTGVTVYNRRCSKCPARRMEAEEGLKALAALREDDQALKAVLLEMNPKLASTPEERKEAAQRRRDEEERARATWEANMRVIYGSAWRGPTTKDAT